MGLQYLAWSLGVWGQPGACFLGVGLVLRWSSSLSLRGCSWILGSCGAWFHLIGLALGFVVRLGAHFSLLPPLRGYLFPHWVVCGWGWVMWQMWDCLSYLLQCFFSSFCAQPRCCNPSPETLVLVKVVLHMDGCSNWYFCEGMSVGNCCSSILLMSLLCHLILPLYLINEENEI